MGGEVTFTRNVIQYQLESNSKVEIKLHLTALEPRLGLELELWFEIFRWVTRSASRSAIAHEP